MLTSAIDYDALPLDYRNRIEDFDCRIAQHEMRMEVLSKAKHWNSFSLCFDAGCVGLGGFFFHETWRVANEEASFLVAVTGNPAIRRIGTPFPFFSTLFIVMGLCFIPPDLVSRSATKRQLQLESDAVARLERARIDVAEEGMMRKKPSQVPIQ